MADLAQKLLMAAQVQSSDPSLSSRNPMANTVLNRQKAQYRIGLWPIISASEAEIGTGMGIGLVLAALLEEWPSISVYRLLAKVGDIPFTYQWKIEDSQFGVDDWELEGLDENVAIWGEIAFQGEHIKLTLEVEDDSRADEDTLKLDYESDTLANMLNQLPTVSMSIVNWLNDSSAEMQTPYETITTLDVEIGKNFLEDVFLWELDYFLELWGQGTTEADVLESQDNLVNITTELDSNFGAWVVTHSISRFVLFDQTNWSEWLYPTLKQTASTLSNYPIVTENLSTTLFQMGENLEAFDLLETNLSLHPEDRESWLLLGDMYLRVSEDLSAIDVYQRAIEADVESKEIYLKYGSLMDSLVEHQIELNEGTNRVSSAGRPFTERYVLTDSDEDSPSLRESCAAYRRVIELDASNVDASAHLVIGLLSLNDPDAWSFFSQLIDKDKEGTNTASVIEQVDDDDVPNIIDVLQSTSTKNPHDLSLHLNLARAYLALQQNDKAKEELSSIPIGDAPSQLQAGIAKLRLSADDSDFDAKLGEIQDILNAKNQANSEDIEFLEAAIEKEPLYSEGYRLLAQSYLSWYEQDDALEVLLDGQKTAPFDTDLLALLARVLWDADQSDLAFAYLEQGLDHNSRNATLLSLMGRFLFDNGEDDEAKDYLRQAEAADPLNSELSTTRFYIANTLIRSKKSDNS